VTRACKKNVAIPRTLHVVGLRFSFFRLYTVRPEATCPGAASLRSNQVAAKKHIYRRAPCSMRMRCMRIVLVSSYRLSGTAGRAEQI
jgi:hypothetical protein